MSSKSRSVINAELDRIREENGGTIKPQHVVEFARDPNTALHAQFTWDDSRAAQLHRLAEASRVIRVYVTKLSDVQSSPVRALVSLSQDRVRGSGFPGYRSISDVMDDEQLRENLIQTALMELRAFKRKYEQLKEFARVWPILESIEAVHRPPAKEDRASA